MKSTNFARNRKAREQRRVRRALAVEFFVLMDWTEKLQAELRRAVAAGAITPEEAREADCALDYAWHELAAGRPKAV